MLSNPPWMEPKKGEVTTAENWLEKTSFSVANRQIASIFALRAMDYLMPGGRVCLIMPVGQLVSPSAKDFLRSWLTISKPMTVVNFADLQQLLFKSASHSCFIAVAEKRDMNKWSIPPSETFEYMIPKADLSLALGRLTLQSSDRHKIQTQSVFEDHQRLATLMWGSEEDLALITKLRVLGSINDFLIGPVGKRRWVMRGGVHLIDNNTTPVSAEPIKNLPYLQTTAFKVSPGVLHPDYLSNFPEDVDEVANITPALLSVFDGPRVLFPDGFDSQRQLRSAYFEKPAAFPVSINAISGPKEDANLLKFLSVFLRSKLASYFLIMTSWQVVAERNAVRNINIKRFPFCPPKDCENPDKASSIISEVASLLKNIETKNSLEVADAYLSNVNKFDELVFKYYNLSEREVVLVDEAIKYISPSIRPRSHKKLFTILQHKATKDLLEKYAIRLKSELSLWQKKLNGKGHFQVDIISSELDSFSVNAIIRVDLIDRQRMSKQAETKEEANVLVDGMLLDKTLEKLNSQSISTLNIGNSMQLSLDTFIWVNNKLFISRPMSTRNWLQRNAIKDARLIVFAIQNDSVQEGM